MLGILTMIVVFLAFVTLNPTIRAWLVRTLGRSRRVRRHHPRSHKLVTRGPPEHESLGRKRHVLPEVLPDGNAIPNVVHYVFGLERDFGHIKFGLTHYLSILGTTMNIGPQFIKWTYRYLPEGVWWNCASPHLHFNRVEDVTHVHGRPRPMRVQHKADILRMQIMLNEGGMYMDSDVIPLRSWGSLRNFSNLVMGKEGEYGLCNAVMLGAANTTFINRWWAEYATFDPEKQWAYHSVSLPKQLQGAHPSEVTVLSPTAFFTPSFEMLTAMYDKDDKYSYTDNFAVHLWTSADPNKRELIRHLSIGGIFKGKGSFQRVARKLLVKAYQGAFLCPYAHEQVAYYLNKTSDAEIIRDWGTGGGVEAGDSK